MATTTNYSWTTPDDTDLVKDGASAIRSLGSAIDSTVFTNAGNAVQKSTIDAKGDLLVGTADNTVGRLAVGTNGYTLVADSSTSTGLKWAAASSGALTLVSATTFSAVASHSVNSVFTLTYKYYRAILVLKTSTYPSAVTMRFRAGGTDNSSNEYYSVQAGTDTGATAYAVGSAPATSSRFFNQGQTDFNTATFDIIDPQATEFTQWTGTQFQRAAVTGGLAANYFGGAFNGTTAFDGLSIITASGTITGTLKIYGYQN